MESRVNATGTGFPAGLVNLTFGSTTRSLPCVTGNLSANSTGYFSCVFEVPLEPAGIYVVAANNSSTVAKANFTVLSPTLKLAPDHGFVGTTTWANGSGYEADTALSLHLGGIAITSCVNGMGSLETNATGNLSCAFTVPSLASGSYAVTVSDGTNSASATFTIDSPTLAVSPSSGAVGTTVNVSGTGFVADAAITVSWDAAGSLCPGATANSTGEFLCSFAAPPSVSGYHSVSATDSTNSGSAAFRIKPSLRLSPSNGSVGSSVDLSGAGFAGDSSVAVAWDGSEVYCAPAATDASGSFSCSLRAPASVSGAHDVLATDSSSDSASATFTITSELNLLPNSGSVGSSVTATGTGFDASSFFSVVWNSGATVCSGTTDDIGNLSCSFEVPPSPAGLTPVVTLEGTNRVAFNFTVTPEVNVVPSMGAVGTPVEISGDGFNATTVYTVEWNSAQAVCGGVTNSSGSFHCPFVVPASPAGPANLTVTAGPYTPVTQFTVIPALVASPTSGSVGSSATLSGTGFDADVGYAVNWNRTTVVCQGTTGSAGSFICEYTVPDSSGGQYTVTAIVGTTNATASFTVVSSLAAAVAQGRVGTSVGFEGTGFSAASSYTLRWNSSFTLCSGVTNSSGAFNCNGTIPASPGGLHTVSALEGALSATTSFNVTPNLSLSSNSGPNGESLSAMGTGFAALTTYAIKWNSTASVCRGTTNTNGGFACAFLVPTSAGRVYDLVAASGGLTSSARFDVVSALAVSPASGAPGSAATVSGAGYPASAVYSVVWGDNGPTLCTGNTNSNGAFTCAFVVPSVSAGNYTLSVTVGSTTSSLAFSVSSTHSTTTGASSTAFPWWLVAAGVAVGVAAFLSTLLLLRYRRPNA